MPKIRIKTFVPMLLVLTISACGQKSPPPDDTGSTAATVTANVDDEKASASISDYAPCTICHQANGEGVPAAFPPIRNRAAQIASLDGGRAYLVSVVSNGITGPVQIGAQAYNGVMPGHGSTMGPEQIAKVLNYVVSELNDSASSDSTPFTASFVAEVQKSVAGKTMQDTGKRRAELVAQHGDAWPN